MRYIAGFWQIVLVQNYAPSYIFVSGKGWVWEEKNGDVIGIISSTEKIVLNFRY